MQLVSLFGDPFPFGPEVNLKGVLLNANAGTVALVTCMHSNAYIL